MSRTASVISPAVFDVGGFLAGFFGGGRGALLRDEGSTNGSDDDLGRRWRGD